MMCMHTVRHDSVERTSCHKKKKNAKKISQKRERANATMHACLNKFFFQVPHRVLASCPAWKGAPPPPPLRALEVRVTNKQEQKKKTYQYFYGCVSPFEWRPQTRGLETPQAEKRSALRPRTCRRPPEKNDTKKLKTTPQSTKQGGNRKSAISLDRGPYHGPQDYDPTASPSSVRTKTSRCSKPYDTMRKRDKRCLGPSPLAPAAKSRSTLTPASQVTQGSR